MVGIQKYSMKDVIIVEKQSLWLKLENISLVDTQHIIGVVSVVEKGTIFVKFFFPCFSLRKRTVTNMTIVLGSSGTYRSTSSNYLFSLRNKDNLSPFRSPVYRYSQYAIYTSPGYGPTFGGGHDLHISNNADKNTGSYANLGHSYRPPSGYSYSSSNTRALLAGTRNFSPTEVEVYYYV